MTVNLVVRLADIVPGVSKAWLILTPHHLELPAADAGAILVPRSLIFEVSGEATIEVEATSATNAVKATLAWETEEGPGNYTKWVQIPDEDTVLLSALYAAPVDPDNFGPADPEEQTPAEVLALAQQLAQDAANVAAVAAEVAGQKGAAGGVAALDGDGDVVTAAGEKVLTPTQANAAYLTPTQGAHLVAELSLYDYLAEGETMPNDGSTDARTLIQTALNDARAKAAADDSNTRYIVVLPAGRFRIDSSLNPAGSTYAKRIGVRGAGMADTIIAPHGTAAGFALYSRGSGPDEYCAEGCYFSDFTIDLTDATHPDPTGATIKGFIGRGWVDCTFENIKVINSPATAFGTDYPVRVQYINCHVETTGYGADYPLDISGGVHLAAHATSGFGIGFGLRDDESITFIGCTARDCYRGGFFFELQTQYENFIRHADIRLIGCVATHNRIGLSNPGGSGVYAVGCDFSYNSVVGYYGGVTALVKDDPALDVTLIGCTLIGNGIAGAYATGDWSVGGNWWRLAPVFGGHQFIDCRFEDNEGPGILVERFDAIEKGGFTVRGGHIRRNAGYGIHLTGARKMSRDITIEGVTFDGNADTAIAALIPMTAPRIVGCTFLNTDLEEEAQTVGITFHPSEMVSSPIIQGNRFLRIADPLVYAARLEQDYITDNVILEEADDPTNAPRLLREEWQDGTNTEWPVSGDGWTKNSNTTNAWTRASLGLRVSGGAGTTPVYVGRDFGTTGLYAEATITAPQSGVTPVNILAGVFLAMQSLSTRTTIVAGINDGATSFAKSAYYAMWRVNGSTPTLLWESDVPISERHTVGLAREAGSTVTHMFIDGELVHSVDVSSVAASSIAGIVGENRSGSNRYIANFAAMPFEG